MGFSEEPKQLDAKQVIIERIVEVPQFKDVEVERAKFVDKVIEVPRIVYKDVIVERAVFVDKEVVVTQPVVKEVPYKVQVPVFEDVTIERPNFVSKDVIDVNLIPQNVIVDRVEVKYVDVVKEVPVTVYKLVEKEKEVLVDRAVFKDRIVEVIKPKYLCQKCGHEVQ